ncbi:hypothetical protein GPECTOR_123g475 [Gonium pectorale]|uniref:COR domain-containing protein n=1 Tax=Gonium pectorale TaxID=33097 RepID=A0A150FYL2_GONPE|nr:hypothetical protein GPECTOR_123g475 [Gonium pectorale]|eukprot:KXZ42703.1 hypothetical protein GPECTOR_123g475 [Gonium pectorale]
MASAVKVAARSSLVLAGPGGAGKTTLAVRLVTGEFENPDPTHGLLVHEWPVPECEGRPPLLFSIWDLGGQEVYWSTHAFFMVREAQYVTVYNSRNNDKDCVSEYLDRVKLLVPGKAPLLVATRAWEGGYEAQEPPAPVLQAHGIDSMAIIRLSSETGRGVDELKQAIISAAAKTSGPSDWLSQANLQVREEVRRMREDLVSTGQPPLITLGELEVVAKRVSIAAPQDLRRCMDRLTDMGELRHFSDVPGLEDVVVIDPRWLADLMAKIVTTNEDRVRELGLNQGRTSMEALKKVVESECPPSTDKAAGLVVESECPPSTDKAAGLVRLMQHCGLVYAAAGGAAFVPPMLPDRMKQPLDTLRGTLVAVSSKSLPEPRRWWSAQYQYGRLPDNRLSRLLCRVLLLLPDAEVLDVWRFGALLHRPQRAVLALTCSRQEMAAVYTLHVAVCSPAPELLGARVSALLGEELEGMEVRRMRYALVSTGRPPLVPLGKLEEAAKRFSIAAPQDLRRCMDRLTDMGELRHFSDVPGLEDVVVIDPRWLADLMAKIVTTNKDRMQELSMKQGRTTMEALQKVVESVCLPSTSKATGLVRLMQHCGLVYAAADGAAVVPPMLPDRMKQPLDTLRGTLVEMSSESLPEPRRWWSAQYEYGRLPDHRLSRLLCRLLLLLPDAEVLDVWRFGALLRRPQRAVLALTCSRQEMAAVYTLHVAVCSPAPELLGAQVSALLGEELDGMELKGIQYECPSCLEKQPKDKQGTYKAHVLQSRAQNKFKEVQCSHCGAELPLAPFIRALRLDEQAAPWSPGQQQRTSDGGKELRHLQAGIELLADWLAAAAGGQQGQQRQGGPPDDAGGGGPPPLPELGEPELQEARHDLVRRVVAVHRLVSTPERRGHLPLLVALLPPPPPICGDGPGGAGSSGSPPPLRLHPVCEHPEGPHLVEGHPGYDIPPLYDDPPGASWLRTHARGLRPLMRAMERMWRHGPQEAQGQVPAPPRYPSPKEAAILQAVLKRLEQEESEAQLSSCQPGSSSLPEGGGEKPGELDEYVSCQEARSSIEKLLEEGEGTADGGRSQQGPLRRVVSRSGAAMWLCPCHAKEHAW